MATVYTEPLSPYLDPQGPTTTTAYAESLAHPERRPLSICLDVPPSSSPFPSPSSSFLPPPIPGNHEFAMRPPPPGRSSRTGSVAAGANGNFIATTNGNGNVNGKEAKPNSPIDTEEEKKLESSSDTPQQPSLTSSSVLQGTLIPPAASEPTPTSTPTLTPTLEQPTAAGTPIPLPVTPTSSLPSAPASLSSIRIPSPLPSPSASTSTQSNTPTSNRPAPPSPATSRRISSISTLSTRSRTPATSTTVSRANSVRRSPLNSNANALSHAQFAAVQIQGSTPQLLIHVRDFAFDKTDERFRGAGALVPRANHLAVLHRKLAGLPDDEDDETSESDADGDDIDDAWDKLRGGWSSIGVVNGWSNLAAEDGPTQEEMDRNFGGANQDGGEAYEAGEGEEEEPLYPGLYRALYAFEPEGTAEMALAEDQVVRVIGRGGGVGWAVVVDESAGVHENGEPKHALVPESYLEVVRFDWEDEQDSA